MTEPKPMDWIHWILYLSFLAVIIGFWIAIDGIDDLNDNLDKCERNFEEFTNDIGIMRGDK